MQVTDDLKPAFQETHSNTPGPDMDLRRMTNIRSKAKHRKAGYTPKQGPILTFVWESLTNPSTLFPPKARENRHLFEKSLHKFFFDKAIGVTKTKGRQPGASDKKPRKSRSDKGVTVLRPAVWCHGDEAGHDGDTWPDAQLLESATVDLASAKLGYHCRTELE